MEQVSTKLRRIPVLLPISLAIILFPCRLDADRHLKLRLASAIVGRSAQQMVTEALDAYLGSLPDVDRLAQQLPRARGDN